MSLLNFVGNCCCSRTFWMRPKTGARASKVEGRVTALRVCFRLRLVRLAALDAVWPLRVCVSGLTCGLRKYLTFASLQELL